MLLTNLFTARLPDTSNTSATLVTKVQHQCNMNNASETWTTRVQQESHECNTSAARTTWLQHEWKTFILITTKVVFPYIFDISHIYYMANERLQGGEKFVFEKCSTKTEFCNSKSCIKKLYTRLPLKMPLDILAWLRIVTQPCFW